MPKDDLYLICTECGNQFVFTRFQQREAYQKHGVVEAPASCLVCQVQQARMAAKKRETETRTGRIKWFNRQKGFGFIELDDGSEIFIHHSGIVKRYNKHLKRGQAVRFMVEKNDKGPQATQLTVLEESLEESNAA